MVSSAHWAMNSSRRLKSSAMDLCSLADDDDDNDGDSGAGANATRDDNAIEAISDSGSWDSIVTTLQLNALYALALLFVFEGFRKKRSVFSKRLRLKPARTPPAEPRGALAWVTPVWAIDGKETLRCVGLDAYMFLRVCRVCLRICLFDAFFGLTVLLPLYARCGGGRWRGAWDPSDAINRSGVDRIASPPPRRVTMGSERCHQPQRRGPEIASPRPRRVVTLARRHRRSTPRERPQRPGRLLQVHDGEHPAVVRGRGGAAPRRRALRRDR